MDAVSISDKVLIGTTLFLGVVALLTPLIGEGIKSRWLRPVLELKFDPMPPGCHKTRLQVRLSPAQLSNHDTYYFRFQVTNRGRTQARKCEAVLEDLWIADAAGSYRKYETLTPTPLQ